MACAIAARPPRKCSIDGEGIVIFAVARSPISGT